MNKINNYKFYKCPYCHSCLNNEVNILKCENCKKEFYIENDIAIFSLKKVLQEKGLYTKIFHSPKIYDLFVRTKHFFLEIKKLD